MLTKLLVSVSVLLSFAPFAAAGVNFDGPAAAVSAEVANGLEPAAVPAAPAPVKTAGRVLVPAKTIQLRVEQNSVDLSGYYAELSVYCSYMEGLMWPESKSCGRRTVPAALTAQGRLLIPAIEAFDGYKGENLDNFEISVVLRNKNNRNDYLFSIGAHGRAALEAYAREDSVLSVLKFDAASVEVLVGGAALAGSELSKDPGASLHSFVSIQEDFLDLVMLVSPLNTPQSFDNRDHGYAKESLAEFRALSLRSSVLVEKAGSPRKLELVTTLRIDGASGMRRSVVEIPRTMDGLARIRQVDLK